MASSSLFKICFIVGVLLPSNALRGISLLRQTKRVATPLREAEDKGEYFVEGDLFSSIGEPSRTSSNPGREALLDALLYRLSIAKTSERLNNIEYHWFEQFLKDDVNLNNDDDDQKEKPSNRKVFRMIVRTTIEMDPVKISLCKESESSPGVFVRMNTKVHPGTIAKKLLMLKAESFKELAVALSMVALENEEILRFSENCKVHGKMIANRRRKSMFDNPTDSTRSEMFDIINMHVTNTAIDTLRAFAADQSGIMVKRINEILTDHSSSTAVSDLTSKTLWARSNKLQSRLGEGGPAQLLEELLYDGELETLERKQMSSLNELQRGLDARIRGGGNKKPSLVNLEDDDWDVPREGEREIDADGNKGTGDKKGKEGDDDRDEGEEEEQEEDYGRGISISEIEELQMMQDIKDLQNLITASEGAISSREELTLAAQKDASFSERHKGLLKRMGIEVGVGSTDNTDADDDAAGNDDGDSSIMGVGGGGGSGSGSGSGGNLREMDLSKTAIAMALLQERLDVVKLFNTTLSSMFNAYTTEDQAILSAELATKMQGIFPFLDEESYRLVEEDVIGVTTIQVRIGVYVCVWVHTTPHYTTLYHTIHHFFSELSYHQALRWTRRRVA